MSTSSSSGRHRALIALLLLGLTLVACGGGKDPASFFGPTSSTVPPVVRREVEVDGVRRGYRLFTPAGPTRPASPLVLALHGGGNTAESLVETTQLDRAATANGFVVVYPEAPQRVWNGGFCCRGDRGGADADLAFLDRVLTDVASVRTIDPKRVYAVGVSAGGVMAYRLGCNLAGRITGVGSVAGAMLLDDCTPSQPVSVIELHGTDDQIVPYAGGVIPGRVANQPAPSSMAILERWARLDACPGPPTSSTEATVTTTSWAGCASGAKLRLVTVEGGGHNWFATEFGLPNGAVDATTAILQFFDLDHRP